MSHNYDELSTSQILKMLALQFQTVNSFMESGMINPNDLAFRSACKTFFNVGHALVSVLRLRYFDKFNAVPSIERLEGTPEARGYQAVCDFLGILDNAYNEMADDELNSDTIRARATLTASNELYPIVMGLTYKSEEIQAVDKICKLMTHW